MLSQKCGRIDTHAEIRIIYDDMHKHCSLFWIHILYVNVKKKKGGLEKHKFVVWPSSGVIKITSMISIF